MTFKVLKDVVVDTVGICSVCCLHNSAILDDKYTKMSLPNLEWECERPEFPFHVTENLCRRIVIL